MITNRLNYYICEYLNTRGYADIQMFAHIRIFRYSKTSIYAYTKIGIHVYAKARISAYASRWESEYTDIQTGGNSNRRVYTYGHTQIRQYLHTCKYKKRRMGRGREEVFRNS